MKKDTTGGGSKKSTWKDNLQRGTGFGDTIQTEEKHRGDVSRVTPWQEKVCVINKFLKRGRWDHGKENQGQMVINKGKRENNGWGERKSWSGLGFLVVDWAEMVKGWIRNKPLYWVSLLSPTCRLSHPARRGKWMITGFREDECGSPRVFWLDSGFRLSSVQKRKEMQSSDSEVEVEIVRFLTWPRR